MEKKATTRTKGNINDNAVNILKQVVQQRNWHQGKIERRLANATKKNLSLGKVSYEKASTILEILGYRKVKEETWRRLPEKEQHLEAAKRTGVENIALGVKYTRALYTDEQLAKPRERVIRFDKKKNTR